MSYHGGFSTSKNGSFWHILVVQVYLISNSQDSPLFKLLYRIGRDDVTAHSNMRPPFSEVKTSPSNRYLP